MLVTFGKVISIMAIYLFMQIIIGTIFGLVIGMLEVLHSSGLTDVDDLGQAVADRIISHTGTILLISASLSLLIYALIDRKKGLRQAWSMHPISFTHILLLLVLGASCGLVMGYILNFFSQMEGLKYSFETYEEMTGDLLGESSLLLLILAIGIAAPVIEEILFRGMVFRRLRETMRLPFAFILQSLLFGLYHFNWIQSTYATVLGLLLTWIFLRYGSIFAAICVHMGINVFGVISTTEIMSTFLNDYAWLNLGLGIVVFGLTVIGVLRYQGHSLYTHLLKSGKL